MRRLQLTEMHEATWFPPAWRNLLTEFLAAYTVVFKPYGHIVDLVADALRRTGETRIVDLAAGGGAAALELKPALDRALGRPVTIVLTDKYPNHGAFATVAARYPGEIEAVAEPVDATEVPATLTGLRTMFSSFHHFDPARARRVLESAVGQRQGIAVFEYTERRPLLWAGPLALTPALVWCLTPFIRPFTWQRLLWTYLAPVVPLVALWDGAVSVLRSYTPEELEDLTARIDASGYTWTVGRARSLGMSRVTYLLGMPTDRCLPSEGSGTPRASDRG